MPDPALQHVEIDILVPEADAMRLRSALGLADDAPIEDFLGAVAKVSAELWLEELLGRAEYPTKLQARQRRIRLLIKHAFNDRIPSPATIAAPFHVPTATAAAALSATLARHSVELASARNNTVADKLRGSLEVELLDDADPINNLYQLHCTDVTVVNVLKETLIAHEEAVVPMTKNREATNVYDLHGSAVAVLEAKFGVPLGELVVADSKAEIAQQADDFASQQAKAGRRLGRRGNKP